ncbi:hypothetical protein TNCV_4164791 [Trichonephila clavipes]|nr:hypothetical protein TNCV_4164791 [Trichonephila clavipes]
MDAEVHEQMSRFGGLSEERPSVFKTPSKLGSHLSTQCGGMKGRVDLTQPVKRTPDLWCESTIHYHSILFGWIVAYRNCGLSYQGIAAHVSRDPMTASRVWNRWVPDGNTKSRARPQRPLSLESEKTGMLPA